MHNLAICLGVPLLVIAGLGLSHAQMVTLGGVFNTSGWPDDERSQYAAELAIADFNVYSSQIGSDIFIVMVAEDTEDDDSIALSKIQSLQNRGIDLIVGVPFSNYINVSYNYIHDNNMLVISHAAQATEQEIDDNIFRILPNSGKETPVLSSAIQGTGIDTLVTISQGNLWGNSIVNGINDTFDGEVIKSIQYTNDTDFSQEISIMNDEVGKLVEERGADRIGILFMGSEEVIAIIQQMAPYESLNSVRWFGTDRQAAHKYMLADPVTLGLAEAAQFTATTLAVPDNVLNRAVDERFLEKYGVMPSTYNYAAYDAVWLLSSTILHTQSTDVDTLVNALPLVASHTVGASGYLELSEGGDLNNADYQVWQIVNGEWVQIPR